MKLLSQKSWVCQPCARSLYCTSRAINGNGNSQVGRSRRYASQIAPHRPLRIGIVGSGPAGFYAASKLMQKIEDVYIDMYEQLPAPFGLVRFGVAPDHPEVKV